MSSDILKLLKINFFCVNLFSQYVHLENNPFSLTNILSSSFAKKSYCVICCYINSSHDHFMLTSDCYFYQLRKKPFCMS